MIERSISARVVAYDRPANTPRAAVLQIGVRSPARYGRNTRPPLPAGADAASAESDSKVASAGPRTCRNQPRAPPPTVPACSRYCPRRTWWLKMSRGSTTTSDTLMPMPPACPPWSCVRPGRVTPPPSAPKAASSPPTSTRVPGARPVRAAAASPTAPAISRASRIGGSRSRGMPSAAAAGSSHRSRLMSKQWKPYAWVRSQVASPVNRAVRNPDAVRNQRVASKIAGSCAWSHASLGVMYAASSGLATRSMSAVGRRSAPEGPPPRPLHAGRARSSPAPAAGMRRPRAPASSRCRRRRLPPRPGQPRRSSPGPRPRCRTARPTTVRGRSPRGRRQAVPGGTWPSLRRPGRHRNPRARSSCSRFPGQR